MSTGLAVTTAAVAAGLGENRRDLVGKTNPACYYGRAVGRSEVSVVGGGDSNALDRSLNSNASQANRYRCNSHRLSQLSVPSTDLVS